MWFLTSIIGKGNSQYESIPEAALNNHRTFGFFNTYNEAYDAVQKNLYNMQECLYDYLVMEYIEPGVHPTVHKEEWYKWDDEISRWIFIERPVEFMGLVNFALG